MTDNSPAHTESRTPAFAWIILAGLGVVDFVRGFMHTFLVHYSASNIAGLDLTHSAQNQMFLLGIFGISNYLTGAIFLVIAFRARHLVPTILALIPLTYAIGLIGLRLNATPEAAFRGRTFMLIYMGVCVLTCVAAVICMRRKAA
ncbi:MAG: hypothetical protein ABI615_03840 [Chthoniobacterales bacterium]